MGPLTQLLELQEVAQDAVAPARQSRARLRIPGTLVWWGIGIGIGTAWTGGVVALAVAVRY